MNEIEKSKELFEELSRLPKVYVIEDAIKFADIMVKRLKDEEI